MQYYRNRKVPPLREYLFGRKYCDPSKDSISKEVWLGKYKMHNSNIRHVLHGKKNFIEMNIVAGDGWEKLCKFLEKDAPGEDFPHDNRRKKK